MWQLAQIPITDLHCRSTLSGTRYERQLRGVEVFFQTEVCVFLHPTGIATNSSAGIVQ